jgi:hypothetical protein
VMPINKKYKVMVHGQNFLLQFEGERRKVGFYTTFFLEAPDPKYADNTAADLLRADQNLRDNVLNEPYDPPYMASESIEEVESFDGCHLPRTGLVFYKEADGSETEQNDNTVGGCRRFKWPSPKTDP